MRNVQKSEKVQLSCTITPTRGESLLNCTYFVHFLYLTTFTRNTRPQHVRIFITTTAQKSQEKQELKFTDIKKNFTLKKLK